MTNIQLLETGSGKPQSWFHLEEKSRDKVSTKIVIVKGERLKWFMLSALE